MQRQLAARTFQCGLMKSAASLLPVSSSAQIRASCPIIVFTFGCRRRAIEANSFPAGCQLIRLSREGLKVKVMRPSFATASCIAGCTAWLMPA